MTTTLIYVETTRPSFYSENRKDPKTEIRRQWTREWWDLSKPDQRLVTSSVVFEELERIPDEDRRLQSLALIKSLEQLDYIDEVAEVVEMYLRHKLVPVEALGDADHLALASYYNCDMLVTWNCKHLANANKIAHIR